MFNQLTILYLNVQYRKEDGSFISNYINVSAVSYYLTTTLRPNISHTVHIVNQFMHNPSHLHLVFSSIFIIIFKELRILCSDQLMSNHICLCWPWFKIASWSPLHSTSKTLKVTLHSLQPSNPTMVQIIFRPQKIAKISRKIQNIENSYIPTFFFTLVHTIDQNISPTKSQYCALLFNLQLANLLNFDCWISRATFVIL